VTTVARRLCESTAEALPKFAATARIERQFGFSQKRHGDLYGIGTLRPLTCDLNHICRDTLNRRPFIFQGRHKGGFSL